MHNLEILAPQMRAALAAAVAVATLATSGSIAIAQSTYPERSIRIVTINAAGGSTDIIARLIGDKLSASLGKPIVVENMPGAGGGLAAGHVAKAAPDGYTLLMSGDAALVTNISLYVKLPYDPVKDLAPISQVVATPNVLVVPADLPVRSVAELAALVRSKPATFTFAHNGLGFSTHLSGELFKTMGQIDLQHVMFRQSVFPDLIAGRVNMCFCNISQALPLAREGKLRALAVTSSKRSPAAPDLPTMDESGFPGFDVTSWFAVMAPAGTPQPIVDKLHGEIVRVLAMPDIRQKMADLGMEIIGNSPAELADLIKKQTPQRAELLKAAGVKPE
jgi:tripartite-type tricarboxylate transporter receptor subunit TctC